jgi:hypothetical protein
MNETYLVPPEEVTFSVPLKDDVRPTAIKAHWPLDRIVKTIFQSNASHFEIYYSTKRGYADETDYELYFELASFNPSFKTFTVHCEKIVMEMPLDWTLEDITESFTFARKDIFTSKLFIFCHSMHVPISPLFYKTIQKWQMITLLRKLSF